MYVDCHAHLFFTPFHTEKIDKNICGEIPAPTMEFITKMIFNAQKKGVSHIVGVISNPDDFSCYHEQLKLEKVLHVIGISRNHSVEDHSRLLSLLESEIERKVPHGIGEIGLDYTYGFDELTEQEKSKIKNTQQELFGSQIKLAKELNIPIVVHAGYGTDKDIVKVIKQEKAHEVGGQIHGYMSDEKLVSELLELGFYFSFGYLHTREEELKRIIDITPIERILTETDSPYHLLEFPKRFILPEDVILITEEIAKIKEIESVGLAKSVMKNISTLFRF